MRGIAAIAILVTFAVSCGGDSPPVDAGGIDVIGVDSTSASGAFGDPCTMHTECVTGYCVEPIGGAGGVCSRTCAGDCPPGYDCLPVEFPNTEVQLCVPSTARLCARCVADSECPGGICTTIDNEKRCAPACSGNDQCPIGYVCAAEAGGAHPGTFCQPVTGSCTCSAEMAGAQRTCTNSNAIGTCLGTQTCNPTAGWSACNAATAATESCDGVDNNCNFVIDDGVGGGEACTNTNGFGSCPGVRTCAGAQSFICQGPTPAAEKCNSLDDNCNGSTDEGFAGLGNSCSAGVGACTRFGTVRCNAGGTGTECSAAPGTPATELCNRIDDDCDTKTDETFTTLGQQCSVGLGICERFGSNVCNGAGTGVTCSATPGTPAGSDTCNFQDDDCDGKTDENFRDPVSGFYDTDTNCGTCGNDCTQVFNGPNASGACVVVVQPLCEMRCDPNTADLNSSTVDGCEFVLDAAAVYVSISDAAAVDDSTCGLGPTGTGGTNHPCKSITQGIARATTLGRSKINVADGTYNEAVTLVNGKNLFGGFRSDTWERHLATTSTVIQGASTAGNHDRTVIATGITTATVLEGFVIRGSSNTKAGGNSYAIYVSGSNANLSIRDNQIFGGRGGPGAAGGAGTNGSAGVDGGPYSSAAYDSKTASGAGVCDAATNNRPGIGGGVKSCGSDNVSGGNGGGNNCTPVKDTRASTTTFPAAAGQPGVGSTGGTAGVSGFDALHRNNSCFLPLGNGNQVLSQSGTDGKIGGDGAVVTAVAGCTAATNAVVGGHWVGGTSTAGNVGFNGSGGGGGGAGGGAAVQSCMGVICTAQDSELGGRGGGGGSGGCGGNGGGAGGTGGGAFGIFITGGTAPTITNNTISGGTAGDGGGGGLGGAGGLGGTGSQGGVPGTLFCTGQGGRGGDGGNGGAGGGGGGGCGGSGFGIFTQGIGTPTYCGSNSVTAGTAGAAGSGGFSPGSSGGAGVAGAAAACTSI